MGYSLRSAAWRYTAWFKWNGTLLRPIVPPLGPGGTAPVNGSRDGFYSELYHFPSGTEDDIDSWELHELGDTHPDVATQMYKALLQRL